MEDRHSIHLAGTWHAPDPELSYLGIYDGHGGRDMVDFLEHALPFHVAQELQQQKEQQAEQQQEQQSSRLPQKQQQQQKQNLEDNNNRNKMNGIQEGSEDVECDGCSPPSIETRLERAFLMADLHARQVGIKTSGATVAICLVKVGGGGGGGGVVVCVVVFLVCVCVCLVYVCVCVCVASLFPSLIACSARGGGVFLLLVKGWGGGVFLLSLVKSSLFLPIFVVVVVVWGAKKSITACFVVRNLQTHVCVSHSFVSLTHMCVIVFF